MKKANNFFIMKRVWPFIFPERVSRINTEDHGPLVSRTTSYNAIVLYLREEQNKKE